MKVHTPPIEVSEVPILGSMRHHDAQKVQARLCHQIPGAAIAAELPHLRSPVSVAEAIPLARTPSLLREPATGLLRCSWQQCYGRLVAAPTGSARRLRHGVVPAHEDAESARALREYVKAPVVWEKALAVQLLHEE